MREKIIETKNIRVDYKRRRSLKNKSKTFTALRDISIHLNEGETLGIIGKNGCGKSTLLRVLARIILPDKGEIYFKTDAIQLMSAGVGFMPNLSGWDNIFLSGMLLGFSKKELKNIAEEIVEFSELDDFIHQPVKTYSAGMRTRLGFSISINTKAKVLLMDEIMSAGDLSFREKAQEKMRELINSDKSVIVVSHNNRSVAEACSRVYWIKDGVICREGSPEAILEEYRNFMSKNRRAKQIK